MDKHGDFLSTDHDNDKSNETVQQSNTPTSEPMLSPSRSEQNFEMNANQSNLSLRSLDQMMDDLEMESEDENCESNDEMHPPALQMTNNTNLVRSFMRISTIVKFLGIC
jgi:hypothetical protein